MILDEIVSNRKDGKTQKDFTYFMFKNRKGGKTQQRLASSCPCGFYIKTEINLILSIFSCVFPSLRFLHKNRDKFDSFYFFLRLPVLAVFT
jgi:hypothetical protein